MKGFISLKNIIVFVIVLFFVISLCSCGNSTDTDIKEQLEQLQQENNELNKQIKDLSGDNENTKEDDIKVRTENNLEIYLEVLGTYANEDFSLNVSDDYIKGLSSVYVMGRIGTVSQGSADYTSTLISMMEWIDNEQSDEEYLDEFVTLLNDYYEKDGVKKAYDVFSDETYVWIDNNHHCYVACWYKDGFIRLRWDYNEKLNEPDKTEILSESETTTAEKTKSPNSYSSFTNKYGTATTLCVHTGCTNFIAKSGDTNCCETHSNRCGECGCYIDEDAMFCLSCIEKAINNKSQSYHSCEVSGCSQKGLYSVEGLNGTLEFYCYDHYLEMLNLYKDIFG